MNLLIFQIVMYSLLVVFIQSERFQIFFDYTKQYQWPDICLTGTKQSPIDIFIGDTSICPSQIQFKVTQASNGASIIVQRIQNTKDLENPFQDQTFIYLQENQTIGNFYSLEFHWHTPSQHTINGERYDLQMHIVHKSLKNDSRVAVTALLFHIVSDQTKTVFDQLNFAQAEGTIADFPFQLDGKPVFHYKGSLTTPPCSQVVDWFVYVYSQPIKGIKNNGKPNSRNTQKLNNRPIYFLASQCKNYVAPQH